MTPLNLGMTLLSHGGRFLEIFTSKNGFQECSGTDDCIDYLFEGAKEFYEFEDSARAQEIKAFLPHLREVIKSLTTDALTMSGS